MTAKYNIRLAAGQDLDSLVKLEEAAYEKDRFTHDQILYLLTKSRSTTLIVENNSSAVGGAYILLSRLHHGARLYNIAIDPAYQGQGIGYDLLKECELEAARHGCKKMTLEVRTDNEGAIKFYKKMGYNILRQIPDYYLDGTAALKMAKEIDIDLPSQVKYKVPYYFQTVEFTCGPSCLMMALNYYNPEIELSRALEMTIWKEATLIYMASGFGGADGYGLALSALNRGLTCHLVTSMDKTPMLKSVRSPEKREVMKIVHADLKRKAKRSGLTNAIYEFGMEEIIAALYRNVLPIVLISTYRLTGDRIPHWVVVTGFDKEHFFIHDPDLVSYKNRQARARNLRIEKSEFLRMARYGKEVYRCLILIGKKGSI